jgi:gamma-glutamyltranspeptidase/glutathione hydrolase
MVATSQPLAAQAGLEIMRRGGNAFDAAVATAAMLNVVEPTSTGVGGDCFALLYLAAERRVLALNGSGRSPFGMTAEDLTARGWQAMPERGILTVTVPGTVDAWARLLAAHGRMTLADVLAPAIRTAEAGYPVSELIAAAWAASAPLLARQAAARRHYLPGGQPPRPGEVVRLPALAQTLARLAEGGAAAFYQGDIAQAIVATSAAEGGYLSLADLARHTSDWVTPIDVKYRGVRVWQCPPNGQGLVTLMALAILAGLDIGGATWGSPQHVHPVIEALRLGFADARAWVADPGHQSLPVASLLSETYGVARRGLIRSNTAMAEPSPGLPAGDDTVYLAVVDGDGNGCSFINSNYMGFGSGLVAGDTGIALQNRGAGFVLTPGHPNTYAPGKRPYHTIMPGLTTHASDGALHAVFGVMGGHMQPQGQVQILVNMLDFGMDPQRALDAPRLQLLPNGAVALEPWFGTTLRVELGRMGHELVPVARTPSAGHFGGGQIIRLDATSTRHGGSDPRKDGQVVAS